MNTPLYISAIRFPAQGNAAAIASRDFYMLHKLVYAAFPTKETATAARPLFRFDIEGEYGYVYVQTTQEPDWTRLPEAIRQQITGPLPYEIPEADRLRFRLLAKPSWKTPRGHAEFKNRRFALSEETEQRDWLNRKGEQHGFKVLQVALIDRVWYDTKKKRMPDNSPKPLHAVQFDGILTVTDRDKLLQAVANGIGTQKSYGFGLLSLALIP